MLTLSELGHIALVGIGATVVMDAWMFLLSKLGVPGTGFALVGRWVGHFFQGRFAHDAISKSAPVAHEQRLGWLVHYFVGMAFASLLAAVLGHAWLEHPTPWPALMFGVVSVAAPWFVMQPAMGAGIAATKTPTPIQVGLRNLVNHGVFGYGLYLSAAALA